jgi:hypothetical protein
MYSVEKERVEERALLQSIRLIPRIPNTPGPVARDKKVVRPLDVVATPSTMKPRLMLGTPSQGSALPYRPPASRDALKLGTGKVLARKVPIKEVGPGAPVSPVLKADASPLVSPLGLGPVTAATGLLNSAPRKQKQLLDRRAVPIPLPVSVPDGGRPKDGSDERRPSAPTQNRVDFFNALRRKAGLAGTPTIVDKLDIAPPKEEELENAVPEESVEPVADNSYPLENGDRSHESEDTTEEPVEELFGKENGEEPAFDQLYEEDITFMVSLGWDQACVEETDALTQDEIDAFLNKRNELASNGAAGATTQKRSSNHHVRRCQDLQVGSMGSETSGVTTSDSESEDDRHGK